MPALMVYKEIKIQQLCHNRIARPPMTENLPVNFLGIKTSSFSIGACCFGEVVILKKKKKKRKNK